MSAALATVFTIPTSSDWASATALPVVEIKRVLDNNPQLKGRLTILTMTLSGLFLGASEGRLAWFDAGKDMIAIDTLVHNFLHRTGILSDCDAQHSYGVGCYSPGGCADIVRAVAAQIDARTFNSEYPTVFPRFVQHAIWRYCAADGIDVCNGNRIDDRKSCQYRYCYLTKICSKIALNL
jgi:hypothetical protein